MSVYPLHYTIKYLFLHFLEVSDISLWIVKKQSPASFQDQIIHESLWENKQHTHLVNLSLEASQVIAFDHLVK